MLVWSLGPRKLCLEEAKQNQTENTQRAEKSRFSRNWLSVGWKNYTKNLVKFPESWCLQKTMNGFHWGWPIKKKKCYAGVLMGSPISPTERASSPVRLRVQIWFIEGEERLLWVVLPLGKSRVVTNTCGCTGHPPAHLQDTFIIC